MLISSLSITNVTNSVALSIDLSTDNSTKVRDHPNLQSFGTTIEPGENLSSSNVTILDEKRANDSIPSSSVYRYFLPLEDNMVRGYCSLGN